MPLQEIWGRTVYQTADYNICVGFKEHSFDLDHRVIVIAEGSWPQENEAGKLSLLAALSLADRGAHEQTVT